MKISQSRLFELVGVIAVVLSLLFVGVQLLFDRNVAVADQYQRRAEMGLSMLQSFLESESYLDQQERRWENGLRPNWWNEELEMNAPDFTTARDFGVSILTTNIALINFDNLYYQYRQGLLDESYWVGARETLKRTLSGQFARSHFLNNTRSAEFVVLVNEIIQEIELE